MSSQSMKCAVVTQGVFFCESIILCSSIDALQFQLQQQQQHHDDHCAPLTDPNLLVMTTSLFVLQNHLHQQQQQQKQHHDDHCAPLTDPNLIVITTILTKPWRYPL